MVGLMVERYNGSPPVLGEKAWLLCILIPLAAALTENDIVWFAQPEVEWVDLMSHSVNKAAPEIPTVEIVVGNGLTSMEL